MQMTKLFLAMALVMGVASGANAEDGGVTPGPAGDQGHGSVTFNGSVIDAPCTIDAGSVDQVVELGQVSNVALQAGEGTGTSAPKNFQIQLQGCSLATAKTVTTTFAPNAGGDAYLAVNGTAKGVGVVIADTGGQPLKLGQPSKAVSLVGGDNALRFTAYVKGNGVAKDIVPGDFSAVADFSLNYQ